MLHEYSYRIIPLLANLRRNPVRRHVCLDLINPCLLLVEYSCRERHVYWRIFKDVHKIFRLSHATACDYRYAHSQRHSDHEPLVVSFALSIHVNKFEHNLSRPEFFAGGRHRHGAYVSRLASPPDGGLPPAEGLAVWSPLSLREGDDRVRRIRGVSRIDIYSFRVDGYDNGLGSIDARDGFDGAYSTRRSARCQVIFDRIHGVTP
mmetsp:Transcript_22965/g.45864  ORF Transcript_22965/g.45864 Transcript_22965/m.45864 type:complete len:205 (-) Transcript_22965:1304-1918(-)